jgi:hypothetical protein
MGDDGEPEEVTGELVPASADSSTGQRVVGRPFPAGVSPCPGGKPPGWGEFRRKLAALDDSAIETLRQGLLATSLRTRAVYLEIFFKYRVGTKVSLADEDGNEVKGRIAGIIILPAERSDDDGE